MISAVILSYNRRDALRRTLRELDALGLMRDGETIVVDNASRDGSAGMVRAEFPAARVIELTENVGVEGYNIGARAARGDLILTLDDDSWPDAPGLAAARALLETDPRTAAAALLPKHPGTGAGEWRHGSAPSQRWPCMGCGNLVRATAWREVGGYEPAFFLYRNDTDLALKLLAAGYGVAFNPAWVVWHDSPGAARKSERWLRLATRNWVWMARRHGRGVTGLLGLLAGCAWALKLAGLSPARWWCVLRGVTEGVCTRAPAAPAPATGADFWRLVKLQLNALGA